MTSGGCSSVWPSWRASAVTAANYQAEIVARWASRPRPPRDRGPVPADRLASPAVALGAVGTDAIFACPSLTAE